MKLSKKKLIKRVEPGLKKLGYTEFNDITRTWQGLFVKKISRNLYLTLGLTIHRYYESAFNAHYYLSKTTTIGAVWGDIPKEIYKRPSFLLTDSERSLLQEEKDNSKDIWFDGNSENSILNFLNVIELTERRFISQPELINQIEKSKDIEKLFMYSKGVREFVKINNNITNSSIIVPFKENKDIPLIWFNASEDVLSKNKEILNKHIIDRLASDSYRQEILNVINHG